MTTTILTILVGLFGGCNILQFIFWRNEKKKSTAEASSAETKARKEAFELDKDMYDYLMDNLNKTMQEYLELQKSVKETEVRHTAAIAEKCNDIALLRSQVTYLKGLRCYKSDCPHRLQVNPDKKNNDSDKGTTA